jgi:hypothetical protein
MATHLSEHVAVQPNGSRRWEHSVNSAPRTKRRNAIVGVSSLNLATINPIGDFGWVEE